MREEVAASGGVLASIRAARIKKPLTDEERMKRTAVNALADQFGYPRPYPDVDPHPSAGGKP